MANCSLHLDGTAHYEAPHFPLRTYTTARNLANRIPTTPLTTQLALAAQRAPLVSVSELIAPAPASIRSRVSLPDRPQSLPSTRRSPLPPLHAPPPYRAIAMDSASDSSASSTESEVRAPFEWYQVRQPSARSGRVCRSKIGRRHLAVSACCLQYRRVHPLAITRETAPRPLVAFVDDDEPL